MQAAFFTEVFVNLNSDGAITHEVNGNRMFPIDKPIKVTFMLSGAALQPVEIWSPEGWSPIYNFSVSPPKDHTILFIKDAAEWRELDLIPGDFNEPSGISEKLQLGRYRGPVGIVETSGSNIGAYLADTIQEGNFKVYADGGNIYLQDVASGQVTPITGNGKSYHPDIAVPLNGTNAYVVYASSEIGNSVSQITSIITGLDTPSTITTDGMYLYWADTDSGNIQRANLDNLGVKEELVTNLTDPGGIAVGANYLYWTDTDTVKIQQRDLQTLSDVPVVRIGDLLTIGNLPNGVVIQNTPITNAHFADRNIDYYKDAAGVAVALSSQAEANTFELVVEFPPGSGLTPAQKEAIVGPNPQWDQSSQISSITVTVVTFVEMLHDIYKNSSNNNASVIAASGDTFELVVEFPSGTSLDATAQSNIISETTVAALETQLAGSTAGTDYNLGVKVTTTTTTGYAGLCSRSHRSIHTS